MAKGQQVQIDFTQVINELANRLRILEGKQTEFSERLLVMNQNMIGQYQKTVQDVRKLHGQIQAMEKDIENIKNIIRHLTEEASKFARDDKLKQLEKYVELWNPLKFVTEAEVRDIVQNELGQKKTRRKKTAKKHKKVNKAKTHAKHEKRSLEDAIKRHHKH